MSAKRSREFITQMAHWPVLCCLLLATAGAAQAQSRYAVYLVGGDIRVSIGELSIAALGHNDGYQLSLDDAAFSDHFLSMRPFQCLSKQEPMLCYTPYPYRNQRNISRNDLTDLEYDLLFIARTPAEFGINPWNGRYFQMRWQGDVIVGELNEVDLNILASPPEDGSLRPLVDEDLTPSEPSESKWTPQLRIEPMPD